MLPLLGRTSLPPASMYGRCLGHMPEGPLAAVTSEAPMTDDDQVPDRRWQGGSISSTHGPIIVAAIFGVNFPRADVMDQPSCNTCPSSIRQPEEYKYPHNSTVQGIGTFADRRALTFFLAGAQQVYLLCAGETPSAIGVRALRPKSVRPS